MAGVFKSPLSPAYTGCSNSEENIYVVLQSRKGCIGLWYRRKIPYIVAGCVVALVAAAFYRRDNDVTRQTAAVQADASKAYFSALMNFLPEYQGSSSKNIKELETLFVQKLRKGVPNSKVSKVHISQSFGIVADIQYPTWLRLTRTLTFKEQPVISMLSN